MPEAELADLPNAFGRFRQRLRTESLPDQVERGLLGSTYVLCGLRYELERIEALDRDLRMTLEDSTTYQLILNRGIAQGEARGEARGNVREAQTLILRLGIKRFGKTPGSVEAAIRSIDDRERLERIADRLLDAAGWDELLAVE